MIQYILVCPCCQSQAVSPMLCECLCAAGTVSHVHYACRDCAHRWEAVGVTLTGKRPLYD